MELVVVNQWRIMNSITRVGLTLFAIILGMGGLLSARQAIGFADQRITPDAMATIFGGDPMELPPGTNGLCRKTNTACTLTSACQYYGIPDLCFECRGFTYHSCVQSQAQPPHQFCTETWPQPENQLHCGVMYGGEPVGLFNDCPACDVSGGGYGAAKPTSVSIRTPGLDNCANGE